MTITNKEYHYWPKEEKLIEYKNGKPGPELYPVSRDRFNNPFFSLNKEDKSHWIGMGNWERDKGLKTHYSIIRAWIKDIEYSRDGKQIITHYAVELRREEGKDKYIFTFSDKDIVSKNHRENWAWVNKPKQPEIYDGN